MVDNSLGDADYYDFEDYAGYFARLVIIIVDVAVLYVLGVFVWLALAALHYAAVINFASIELFWITLLFVAWIYLAPVKRSEFGTIGYQLLGYKLVAAKGGQPSLLRLTLRMMMWIFGPFNIFLDILWLSADTEKQSLRDCYLGTYLVKRRAKPIGRGPLHLARYNAMGYSFMYPRVTRSKVTLDSE